MFEQVFDHPATGEGDLDPRPHRPGSTRGRPSVERLASAMRRYDDPVETRMGLVSGREGPEQFLWRGRLWKVRAVLAHWVETGPWWQSGSARAVIGSDETAGDRRSSGSRPSGADLPSADLPSADLLGERELWRVEAGRGASPGPDGVRGEALPDHGAGGVFDLAFDWSDGRWALVGCVD